MTWTKKTSQMRQGLSLLAMFISVLTLAKAQVPKPKPGHGWHEAVVSVTDIEEAIRFFDFVAGWDVMDRGEMVTPYATKDTGTYAIVGAPDAERGLVRLVSYPLEGQRPARPNAQAWDTGGIFSVMTRTSSAANLLARAEALGYDAYSDPYALEFGDLSLINIVIKGPGGMNLAAYEWVQPKRGDVSPDSVTFGFNSMQMVADLKLAKAFYVDRLGMEVIMEGTFIDPEDKPTNFALPVNFATQIPRDYVILKAHGSDGVSGRIELMHFRGLDGRDLSDGSLPTALGIVELRIPVDSLDTTFELISPSSRELKAGPFDVDLPPYGAARAFTIASPEGAPITFFELMD